MVDRVGRTPADGEQRLTNWTHWARNEARSWDQVQRECGMSVPQDISDLNIICRAVGGG